MPPRRKLIEKFSLLAMHQNLLAHFFFKSVSMIYRLLRAMCVPEDSLAIPIEDSRRDDSGQLAGYPDAAIPAECTAESARTPYLNFSLPESCITMTLNAEVVWAGKRGHVGFRFLKLPENSRQLLERWLDEQMAREFPGAKQRIGSAEYETPHWSAAPVPILLSGCSEGPLGDFSTATRSLFRATSATATGMRLTSHTVQIISVEEPGCSQRFFSRSRLALSHQDRMNFVVVDIRHPKCMPRESPGPLTCHFSLVFRRAEALPLRI